MFGRDSAVVVTESYAIVAPYYGCASCGAAGGDAAATFAVLLRMPAFGGKPTVRMRGGGEGAEERSCNGLARRRENGCNLEFCEDLATAMTGLG